MNKLKLKHKFFAGNYLGNYKIKTVILQTDTEFDIVLEDSANNIYYSFTYFVEKHILNDEFYVYQWDKKLFGSDYEDLDIDDAREILGSNIVDNVCAMAKFLVENKFI